MADDDADDEAECCFICDVPLKHGDLVLDDVSGGTGHRACFGDDREGFVRDMDTEEPLRPDDPIPAGYVWNDTRLKTMGLNHD